MTYRPSRDMLARGWTQYPHSVERCCASRRTRPSVYWSQISPSKGVQEDPSLPEVITQTPFGPWQEMCA